MALADILPSELMTEYLSLREFFISYGSERDTDRAEKQAAMDKAMEQLIQDDGVPKAADLYWTVHEVSRAALYKYRLRERRAKRFRQQRVALPDCGPAEIAILEKAKADLERALAEWKSKHPEAIWLLIDSGDYDLMKYHETWTWGPNDVEARLVNEARKQVRDKIADALAKRKTPPKEPPPEEPRGLRRVK